MGYVALFRVAQVSKLPFITSRERTEGLTLGSRSTVS
jgi:hypothetical protein